MACLHSALLGLGEALQQGVADAHHHAQRHQRQDRHKLIRKLVQEHQPARSRQVMRQGTAQALRKACGPREASSGEGTNWSAKCSATPAFATRPAYVRGGAG